MLKAALLTVGVAGVTTFCAPPVILPPPELHWSASGEYQPVDPAAPYDCAPNPDEQSLMHATMTGEAPVHIRVDRPVIEGNPMETRFYVDGLRVPQLAPCPFATTVYLGVGPHTVRAQVVSWTGASIDIVATVNTPA